MALESVTVVNDLNPTNPTGADAKSQGDDHIRNLKTALKNSFPGFTGAILAGGVDGGAANVYTLSAAIPAYATGLVVAWKVTNANSGASTLNINGLGAKSLLKYNGSALVSGDLSANQWIISVYTGTDFRIVSNGVLAALSVTTAMLADLSVTTAKISDSNVTTAKIADSNVTQVKLAANVAGNGPAFRVVNGGLQSISATTNTKVQLVTETFDTNNNFDSATNYRFTPTIGGYYQINATVYNNGIANGNFWQANIYKNGAQFSSSMSHSSNGGSLSASVSDVIYLNGSTDYVELYVYCSVAANIPAASSFMSGSLVRAA